MDERRKFKRIKLGHKVLLKHPSFGDITTHTTDMSNGGFYIDLPDVTLPKKGETIMLQLLDTSILAPAKEFTGMRVSSSGIGIAFKD